MTEELLGPMADALDPELVAPVVVYLASDQCDVTGQILSVAGGRVSRVVVADPPGYYSKELTPEQVRDNWGTSAELADLYVPDTDHEKTAQILKAVHG